MVDTNGTPLAAASTGDSNDTGRLETARDELWARLYQENAALQKQIDDERRLRREAEDIIDQRQDEVYEKDAQLRKLLAEQQRWQHQKEVAATRSTETATTPRKPSGSRLSPPRTTHTTQSRRKSSPTRHSSESGGDDYGGDNCGDNERQQSGTTSKPTPKAITTTPPTTIILNVPPSPSTANLGLTKEKAVAAYAALNASVQTFVETRLAPIFASASASNDCHVDIAPSNLARPRSLLKLMNPRASMFLRFKGGDSVHFYAILMEFLRRNVFAEAYGGIFKIPSGPVSSLTSPLSIPDEVEWPTGGQAPSKIEARLREVDELTGRMAVLLNYADPTFTGSTSLSPLSTSASPLSPTSSSRPYTSELTLPSMASATGATGAPPWSPSSLLSAFASSSPTASSSTTVTTAANTTKSQSRHHHTGSDGTATANTPLSLRRETRLLRAQLLDRVLVGSSNTNTQYSASSSLSSRWQTVTLNRHIDARVRELSAELARLLLPLRLTIAREHDRLSSPPSSSSLSTARSTERTPSNTNRRGTVRDGKFVPVDGSTPGPTHGIPREFHEQPGEHREHRDSASTIRSHAYTALEHAVTQNIVRPAVQLAVDMQLAVNVYEVRWVEHARDSPSLSVCEALGLDYKKIELGPKRGGDEAKYSFVFDISPALFMTDVATSNNMDGGVIRAPSVIYPQGVLLQKGEILTERTFVNWLQETGSKPKASSSGWRKKLHRS